MLFTRSMNQPIMSDFTTFTDADVDSPAVVVSHTRRCVPSSVRPRSLDPKTTVVAIAVSNGFSIRAT